jgi:hypothetical protein
VVTAHAFEHTMTHRVLSVLSGLLSVLLAAVIALFMLDASQLRSTMNPQAEHAFTLAMVKAVLDFSIVSIALLVVCIGGLRAGRKAKVFRVMRVESADVSMVVRS